MKITLNNIVANVQGMINAFFTKNENTQIVEETAAKKNDFAIGDIFVESWGYEQTNIDFYQVVKVNKASVILREIAHSSIEATGWASDMVEPVKDDFISEETFTKRVSSGSKYLKGIAHGVLSLHENGKSYHRSWYA